MSQNSSLFTGLDVGDRKCEICVIDADGELVRADKVSTTQQGLERFFSAQPRMRIVLEVCTHSPWISRQLEQMGHEVLVANARRLKAIHSSKKKTDKVDAELLARIGRLDPRLLQPIKHRGMPCQRALSLLRSRDLLVNTRTNLINHVRGTVKSYGYRIPKGATYSFAKRTEGLPAEVREPLQPVIDTIAKVSAEIRLYEHKLACLAELEFPETLQLRQIVGVGLLTALGFVALIEDPHRFAKNRDVGAYLGLCPRLSQSGESLKLGRITKSGDALMRKLLVQASHHILGRWGVDSDLRRWGLRKLAQNGGNRKRVITAMARKLAVLLLSLWKSGEKYEPLRQATAATP